MAATFRDAPACAAQDACSPASRRAAAQKILAGPLVHHRSRLVHSTAKDRVVHLARPASDASVAPDVARLAADLPPQCPEAVRDSRQSALGDAPEPQDAWPFQALPLPDAPPMVVCRCLAQVAAQLPLPVAAPEPLFESKLEPQVAQPQDESELPQEGSEQVSPSELWSQELPCLRAEQQRQALRGAEQLAQPVWSPRAPPFQLQPPAPQALLPQPRAPQPGAPSPLSPPHPSLPCPPWPLLLPQLLRPLLPGDVSVLSPQRPLEWNSSASFFP
jgi:hypothetical protein